jgi:hypothetical protein
MRSPRGLLALTAAFALNGPAEAQEQAPMPKTVATLRANTARAAQLLIAHGEREPQGWDVTKTPHFVIRHELATESAEDVAVALEEAMEEVRRKWKITAKWDRACEVYVHPNAVSYQKTTGMPAAQAGVMLPLRDRGGRLLQRQIHLNVDAKADLFSVIPHETAHAVLDDAVEGKQLPPWAHEGAAILSEPWESQDDNTRGFDHLRQKIGVFTLQDYFAMRPPQGEHGDLFYVQSHSLVRFLTERADPSVMLAFIRDGSDDAAAKKHYKFASLKEMQDEWLKDTDRLKILRSQTRSLDSCIRRR